MPHTVKEVAALSGTSVRTLHHYDEIGLLKPAYYGNNGYRYYEEEQLLLLQQILFYRELEMPLEDIRAVLERSSFDRMEALIAHRQFLLQKAERLHRLLHTVDKTIDHLKGERTMSKEELFEGFGREHVEKAKKDLRARYGDKMNDEPFEQSIERTKDWKKTDYEEINRIYDEIHRAVTAQIEQGAAPDRPEVQSMVRRHYGVISRFYDPSKEMYKGLGHMYVDHPDFRKLFDSYHPRLAEFMRDAMDVFADNEL